MRRERNSVKMRHMNCKVYNIHNYTANKTRDRESPIVRVTVMVVFAPEALRAPCTILPVRLDEWFSYWPAICSAQWQLSLHPPKTHYRLISLFVDCRKLFRLLSYNKWCAEIDERGRWWGDVAERRRRCKLLYHGLYDAHHTRLTDGTKTIPHEDDRQHEDLTQNTSRLSNGSYYSMGHSFRLS